MVTQFGLVWELYGQRETIRICLVTQPRHICLPDWLSWRFCVPLNTKLVTAGTVFSANLSRKTSPATREWQSTNGMSYRGYARECLCVGGLNHAALYSTSPRINDKRRQKPGWIMSIRMSSSIIHALPTECLVKRARTDVRSVKCQTRAKTVKLSGVKFGCREKSGLHVLCGVNWLTGSSDTLAPCQRLTVRRTDRIVGRCWFLLARVSWDLTMSPSRWPDSNQSIYLTNCAQNMYMEQEMI